MTNLHLETLTLPGAPLGPENPLPFFRNPEPNPSVPISDAIPPENSSCWNVTGKFFRAQSSDPTTAMLLITERSCYATGPFDGTAESSLPRVAPEPYSSNDNWAR